MLNKNQKLNKAFSLLEVSIVLVILAIMLSLGILSVAKLLNSKTESKAFEEIEQVRQAIERFKVQNGRYPCPARLNLAPTDANYGKEIKNTSGNNECFAGAAGGYSTANISGGFSRRAPSSATTSVQQWQSSVLTGAVPFVDLGIDGKFAVDKWGNKYVYAVTEILASDINGTTPGVSYDNAPSPLPAGTIPTALRGGIQINDAFTGVPIAKYDAVANANTAADFIILSAGPDGNGAFNKNATTQSPCVSTGVGSKEAQNCDFSNNVFVTSGTFSNNADANYFYDLVSWNSGISNNINVTGSGDFKDKIYIRGRDVAAADYALRVDGRTNIRGANNTGNLSVGNSPNTTDFSLAVDGNTNLDGALTVFGRSEFNNFTVLPDQTESGICSPANVGAIRYNKVYKKLETCDGTRWVNVTAPKDNEVGPCDANNIGALRYNTTSKTLEICDGANWVGTTKLQNNFCVWSGSIGTFPNSPSNASSPPFPYASNGPEIAICPSGWYMAGTRLTWDDTSDSDADSMQILCCNPSNSTASGYTNPTITPPSTPAKTICVDYSDCDPSDQLFTNGIGYPMFNKNAGALWRTGIGNPCPEGRMLVQINTLVGASPGPQIYGNAPMHFAGRCCTVKLMATCPSPN